MQCLTSQVDLSGRCIVVMIVIFVGNLVGSLVVFVVGCSIGVLVLNLVGGLVD